MLRIAEEPFSTLDAYARVPMRLTVRTRLEVTAPAGGLGGLVLTEQPVVPPYVKDYDAVEGGPLGWPAQFDLRQWGLLAAYNEAERVGGAVVAYGTEGIDLLEGRADLAVLWDLRVAPHAQRRGVGQALFRAAEAWARVRGCRTLKVETQHVNVPACRLYARMGCMLGAIHRFAYPTLPGEVQLLWYKALTPEAPLSPEADAADTL